jgi:lipoprotein-anchoring transpeptidase ErfK/SrfK
MRRTVSFLLLLGVLLGTALTPAAAQEEPAPPPAEPGVPVDSGAGRRIVYSNGQQRVWLVEEDGTVADTHLVSGRRNFPRPGNYAVFSRSPQSRAGSVTMQYMVRWYQSKRLAVGFHSIPVTRRGRPIQSEAQLGTFRSHGCVRQRLADAALLWDWAPIGTPVVVVP